jgi:hypothetical protein
MEGQRRSGQDFLAAGTWVPLTAARDLTRSLKTLDAWVASRRELSPLATVLLAAALTKMQDLVELTDRADRLVSAARWERTAREVRLLTRRLAALH